MLTADAAVTPSVAFAPDGTFDESKLAKPADWAALDDFDEEAIIAEMTKRVDETWLSTKAEVQFEKSLHDKAKEVRTRSPASSPRPAAAPAPAPSKSAPAIAPGGGCATCGAQAAKLKRCTACKSVHYCSRECQVRPLVSTLPPSSSCLAGSPRNGGSKPRSVDGRLGAAQVGL